MGGQEGWSATTHFPVLPPLRVWPCATYPPTPVSGPMHPATLEYTHPATHHTHPATHYTSHTHSATCTYPATPTFQPHTQHHATYLFLAAWPGPPSGGTHMDLCHCQSRGSEVGSRGGVEAAAAAAPAACTDRGPCIPWPLWCCLWRSHWALSVPWPSLARPHSL